MSSSGSQRLSRVLFRDDHHHDHDHHNNNAVTEAEAESELDSDLAPGHPHMGCQIISDSDGDRLLDDCMSSCGMHMSEHVDEPSSPFKLTLGPDMTSSPTYIRSVRDLKLLNSPPQTPKSLTRAARCSSGMQVRPSTGAASRTRFSSGRGTKRSYLTPLVANVNPFSPTPSLTTVAVTGHMMHRTSSSSSSATHAATTQGHHNNSSTSTEGHKRVRLSTDGSGHERTLLPAACRLNFNSLTATATATKTSAAGAGAADNCSSDSGHVLLNSTDEMSCGVLACELSGGTDSPFDTWSSESDPPIGTRTENGMTGGGGGVAGGGDGMTGSRYVDEFLELDEIGRGTFGTVYKCQHKLDGLVYAVKVSSEPVRGSAKEKRALNEVYAHAVLGKHLRVVHYYSAWVQDERLYIQNEYCEGGSLNTLLDECRGHGVGTGVERQVLLPEHLVRRILLHVAQGLQYIHSQNLAHMDIKPENIFLTKPIDLVDLLSSDRDQQQQDEVHPAAPGSDDSATMSATDHNQHVVPDRHPSSASASAASVPSSPSAHSDSDEYDDDDDDDGYEESSGGHHHDHEGQSPAVTCFKIGDLGLVTHSVGKEVFEGDCRYLARELLYEDTDKDLTKADVYALGMTIVEVMRGSPLPKNDDDWHRIRDGDVHLDPDRFSTPLRDLVRSMICVEAADRPSASAVVHRLVKSKTQLRRELDSSMARIEELNRQLAAAATAAATTT